MTPQHINKPNIVCKMLPRQLKHKLLSCKSLVSVHVQPFFFSAHLTNFIPANCQRFLLEKISTWAGRPTPASAWQQLIRVWRVEGKAASTRWPQKKHKWWPQKKKKASRSCSSRIGICTTAEKQSSTGQPITPRRVCGKKKTIVFRSVFLARPSCLYSSCWMHVKVKIFSTFQRDVVLQRSSMSLLAQAISARCPPPLHIQEGKGGRNRQNVLQYLWEGSRRSRHWFSKRGLYICLFKTCLEVFYTAQQSISQSRESAAFLVKDSLFQSFL